MTGSALLGSQVTGASSTGSSGFTKGVEVPSLCAAATAPRSCQQEAACMPDRLLRGKPIEAMIALIGWVSAQIFPGPIGIADRAQVLVVAESGGPVRPHVEP